MIALSPNARVDRDMTDNYACGSADEVTLGAEPRNRTTITGLVLAPNPATGAVAIRGLGQDVQVNIVMHDAVGHLVRSFTARTNVDGTIFVDLADHTPGCYSISVLFGQERFTGCLMVQP